MKLKDGKMQFDNPPKPPREVEEILMKILFFSEPPTIPHTPEPVAKSPELEAMCEEISMATFGRSRKDPLCVSCGSVNVAPSDFKDDISRKEFTLSRLCQKCQDGVFFEEK